MYKIIKNIDGGESSAVMRFNADGSVSSIPFAPDNTDYQAYLKWVAEGNTPEPAEGAE
jgi:hypothetical protein